VSPRLPAFAVEHGRAFDDPDVARLYHLRRTYPPETHDIVRGLIVGEPRVVLDAGAGTGEIARAIAPHAERVDALEPSAAMIEAGKRATSGGDPRIRWIHGTAEETPLDGPYALIVCGQSMHWMDWDVVYPRFRDALRAEAFVAIVNAEEKVSWEASLTAIIKRFSANQSHPGLQPGLGAKLEEEKRGLFRKVGEQRTAPVVVRQPAEDYIASHHAMSGLATHRIGAERAAAFDAEVRDLLAPFGGTVEIEVTGHVIWGRPL
jgi:SAM-dependent methyltransferase